jgi:ribosomal protein S18 acetylase RimI-like enzyme
MRAIRFDRLAVGDWERYRSIRLRALQDAPNAFARTHDEEAAFSPDKWRARLAGHSITVIAVSSNVDVGVVSGATWQDRDGYAGLFGMWVADAARGRGVGDGLVKAVVNWARQSGYKYLALDVTDTNASAIALYARLGFEPTGACGRLPHPRDHITEHERRLTL